MTPAQCMLLDIPDLVCCPFNPDAMYILCSWYCIPPLQHWHNVCHAAFLIFSPAPSTPAQRTLLHVPDIVYCLFNLGKMYAILCPWHGVLPLQHRHNVCYPMSLIRYPTPLTLAQCMLLCVPDFVYRPFNASTMYVILCSWYIVLPLQSWHNVCYSMSLICCAAPSSPA